jgi:hypothetical protein
VDGAAEIQIHRLEADGFDAQDALRAREVGLDAFADACEQAGEIDADASLSFAASFAAINGAAARTAARTTAAYAGRAALGTPQPNPNPAGIC